MVDVHWDGVPELEIRISFGEQHPSANRSSRRPPAVRSGTSQPKRGYHLGPGRHRSIQQVVGSWHKGWFFFWGGVGGAFHRASLSGSARSCTCPSIPWWARPAERSIDSLWRGISIDPPTWKTTDCIGTSICWNEYAFCLSPPWC